MAKEEIYSRIRSIAGRLAGEGRTMPRADLAYELNYLGVEGDSLEVSRLVMGAYEFYGDDAAIAAAFTDNEGGRTIVEAERIAREISTNPDAAFKSLEGEAEAGGKALKRLESGANRVIHGKIGSGHEAPGFFSTSTLRGTRGIETVRAAAQNWFDAYSMLLDCYGAARADVKALMADFVQVRGCVADIYRDYAMRLTDMFGDSVKSVAPELFDFDSVQFLGTEEMLQAVRLEYERLDEKCGLLVGAVSKNFSNTLSASAQGASQIYRATENRVMAAATVGVAMLEHYMDAYDAKLRLQTEFEALKQSIMRDAMTVRGDHTRLASIYKIISELYIPKARAFYRYGEQVLSDELKAMFDAMYSDESVGDLARQRDAALEECRKAESEVADCRFNVEYYTGSVARAEEILGCRSAEYKAAMRRKPSRPFFLLNWLSFGTMMKGYDRKSYEWKRSDGPIVDEYNDLQTGLLLDRKELDRVRQELRGCEKRLAMNRRNVEILSGQIRARIKVSRGVKQKMAGHLDHIFRLMRIGKEIVESKLDERHVETVRFEGIESGALPEDVEQRLNAFVESLKGPVWKVTGDVVRQMADGISVDADSLESFAKETTDQVAQRGLNLARECARLALAQGQGRLTRAEYERQLEKSQDGFRKAMAQTDDRSAALRETLRRINTAPDAERLKEALLLLGDVNGRLTREDLDDFLNGTKTIEI